MNENEPQTFSISVTLQRLTKESVNVSVPLTPDLLIENTDGTSSPDAEKLFLKAVQLGSITEGWELESSEISINPIQRP